ncbi:hypothetical protein NDA16_004502 [Ustilago loliicola]|nr:hypothetical protein NDA16_004502 [Ustilago loliicola]
MTSDAPGAATRYIERFRDLDSQANLDDAELSMHLFRLGLTPNMKAKFKRDLPDSLWNWYNAVESMDKQHAINQQAAKYTSVGRNPVPRPPGPAVGTQQPPVPAFPPRPMPMAPRRPIQPPPTAPQGQRPLLPHQTQRVTFGNNTCHICKGVGHWAHNCPSKPTHAVVQPSGPRMGVNSVAHEDDQAQEHSHEPEEHHEDYDEHQVDGGEATEPEFDLAAALQDTNVQEVVEGDDDEQGNESGAAH